MDFNSTDGSIPEFASLVQGRDRNLYGVTNIGGVSNNCTHFGGCGTIFKITAAAVLTTLYDFCAQANCADGEFPQAGLALGTDGNFYGTTSGGGMNGDFGTVFVITPAGVLTTLHSFDFADGEFPQ